MILLSFFRPRLSWILDRIILRQNHEDLDDEGSMALGKKGDFNPLLHIEGSSHLDHCGRGL
jgi:hypothetical protein